MPPETEAIPIPKGRGADAREYLEAHGLVPVSPPIHSSDDTQDEFIYYLRRRLGLVPALSHSDALTTGTWLHLRAEYYDADERSVGEVLRQSLGVRQQELRETCKAFGIDIDKRERILETEEKYAKSAFAIWDSIKDLRVSADIQSLDHWLKRPGFRELGREMRVEIEDKEFGPLVAIFDNLRYHEKQNTIWIVDYKTYDGNPVDRAQVCSMEFQTWLYIYVARLLLAAGWFKEQFDIPLDAKIGGLIHVVIKKPTIYLSDKDRPYRYMSEGKRKRVFGRAFIERGVWHVVTWPMDAPNEQQQIGTFEDEDTAVSRLHAETGKAPTRKHYGERDLDRYIHRLKDWYTGRADPELAAERAAHPPVVFSRTEARILDDVMADFRAKLARIREMQQKVPEPGNFTRTGKALLAYGKLSKYAAFYVVPVKDWPQVIKQENFIIAHRDPETDE